jgi:hypothetical protein
MPGWVIYVLLGEGSKPRSAGYAQEDKKTDWNHGVATKTKNSIVTAFGAEGWRRTQPSPVVQLDCDRSSTAAVAMMHDVPPPANAPDQNRAEASA